MNLSGVVLSFLTGTYSVMRTNNEIDGSDGLAVAGTPVNFTVQGCIQPVTGKDLKRLPEGQEREEVCVLFSSTELKVTSRHGEADIVTVGADTFQVEHVESWGDLGGYWRCVLRRQQTGVYG